MTETQGQRDASEAAVPMEMTGAGILAERAMKAAALTDLYSAIRAVLRADLARQEAITTYKQLHDAATKLAYDTLCDPYFPDEQVILAVPGEDAAFLLSECEGVISFRRVPVFQAQLVFRDEVLDDPNLTPEQRQHWLAACDALTADPDDNPQAQAEDIPGSAPVEGQAR